MTRKKRKREGGATKGGIRKCKSRGPWQSETPDASIAHPENGIEKKTDIMESMDQVEEESHAVTLESEASEVSETQNLGEETQGEEIAGDEDNAEQLRLEKKKRIEELEALVEEAVGEDDFEKAETLQNEIDEIKASL